MRYNYRATPHRSFCWLRPVSCATFTQASTKHLTTLYRASAAYACGTLQGLQWSRPLEAGRTRRLPKDTCPRPLLSSSEKGFCTKAAASPTNELSAARRRSGETLDHGGAAAAAAAALRGGGPLREVVPLQVGAQQDALRVAQVLVPCSASAGIMASAQAVMVGCQKRRTQGATAAVPVL